MSGWPGAGIVSHAGVALVRALADKTGLTGGLSKTLASRRLLVHERGQVLADLACAIADGGEVISDFRVMAERHGIEVVGASGPAKAASGAREVSMPPGSGHLISHLVQEHRICAPHVATVRRQGTAPERRRCAPPQIDWRSRGVRTLPGNGGEMPLVAGVTGSSPGPGLPQCAGQRVQQEVAGSEVGCGGPDALAGDEFEGGPCRRWGPAVDV